MGPEQPTFSQEGMAATGFDTGERFLYQTWLSLLKTKMELQEKRGTPNRIDVRSFVRSFIRLFVRRSFLRFYSFYLQLT